MVVIRRKEVGVVKGKEDQIFGDRRKFDFGGWVHNAIYRSSIIEMYT